MSIVRPRKPFHIRVFYAMLFWLFIACTLMVTILPFLWMVSASLADPKEIDSASAPLLPLQWTGQSYQELFAEAKIPRFFFNSLVFSVGFTLMALVFNSLAGYAFARIQFPRREKLFSLLVLTMMVPSQVTLIPVFLILKWLGMLNSFAGLILPGCAHVFGIFMVRQFILDLPEELFEAARMDGCTEWDIFRRIVLPMCRPIFATLAVLSFVGSWNEFLFPLVIMQTESCYTLPVALSVLTGQNFGRWGFLMAGSVIAAIPSILVFLAAQKHYLRGISAGAVK
ncbi:MAG: carbohydrate ABC transporter permease [Candidatus Ozemobacteraceae bacterium]